MLNSIFGLWSGFFKYKNPHKTKRGEFWISFLGNLLIFGLLSYGLFSLLREVAWVPILCYFVAFCLAVLPLYVRRLRDVGVNCWLVLLPLGVGLISAIIYCFNVTYGTYSTIAISFSYALLLWYCSLPSKYNEDGSEHALTKKDKLIAGLVVGIFLATNKIASIVILNLAMSQLYPTTIHEEKTNKEQIHLQDEVLKTREALAYYYQGDTSIQKGDYQNAYEQYQQSCKLGLLEGCRNASAVDIIYNETPNYKEDFKHLSKSCSSPDSKLFDKDICVHLGILYEQGKGTKKDVLKALQIYETNCSLGSGVSCNNAGVLLFEGERPIKHNKKKAIKYLKDACHKYGFDDACQNLENVENE